MAKKAASGGAANMNSALSNKTSISDLSDDQLAHLGGSRDPIDAEDFSDADFGNDITTSPDDEESSDEVDTDGKKEPEDDKAEEESEDESAQEKDEPADDEEDDSTESRDGDVDGDDEADDKDGEPADDESDAGDNSKEGKDDSEEDPPADESEDDGEAEDEEEPETDQRVPLKRFRDVNKRMREAEKRAEELERRMAALEGNEPGEEETPYDFDAAEERYQDLLLDGQKKDATALRKEIRAAEQATYIKAADAIGGRNAEASHAKRGLDTLAAKYEADYPQMDLTHEDFDPEINLEVQASMIGYIEQGMDSVKAFEKALNKTVKLFDLKPVTAAAPAGGKGKGKAKPGKKEAPAPTKEQLAKQKKAGKEKLAKSKKAPPDTTKVGDPGDGGKGGKKELDVENMSEEEFNALPKSTLARLRGDIL